MQVDLLEAEGKTIKKVRVEPDERWLTIYISYTDGGYSAVLVSDEGDEDLYIDTDHSISPLYVRLELLTSLFGKEVASQMIAAAREEQETEMAGRGDREKERRRQQYEELKQEFGDQS